jgi:hypothetical protein
MFAYRPDETLAELPMPILAAIAEAGTADDEEGRERELALDDIQRRRAERGRAPIEIARFPGAGHNLMRYRPERLSLALLSLLASSADR